MNEVKIPCADLKAALIAAGRIATKNSTIPILTHVLLTSRPDGCTLDVTDLTVSRRQFLAGSGPAHSWRAAVNLQALKATLPKSAKMAGDVEICESISGENPGDGAQQLTVYVDGVRSSLRCLPAEDFPTLPDIGKPLYRDDGTAGIRALCDTDGPMLPPVVFAGEAFRELSAKIFSSISKEDSRFQLSGARIELNGHCRMISTDGHRLHHAEGPLKIESPDDVDFLMPRAMLAALKQDSFLKPTGRGKLRRSPDLHLSWSEFHLQIDSTNGVRYVARILEGTFPDYQRVIVDPMAEAPAPTTNEPHPPDTRTQVDTLAGDLRTAIAPTMSVATRQGDRNGAFRFDIVAPGTPGAWLGCEGAPVVLHAADGNGGEAISPLNGTTAVTGPYVEDFAANMTAWEEGKGDALSGDFPPQAFSVGLNPKYLLDAIRHLADSDDVRIQIRDENSPTLVTAPGDSSFSATVMPIRL